MTQRGGCLDNRPCLGRLPFPVSCPPFRYWCFLGSHSNKQTKPTATYLSMNWLWPGGWTTLIVSIKVLCPPLTQAWWRPPLKHTDHRWRRSCFPEEILGVIINVRKSRFWAGLKKSNMCWSGRQMTPLGTKLSSCLKIQARKGENRDQN